MARKTRKKYKSKIVYLPYVIIACIVIFKVFNFQFLTGKNIINNFLTKEQGEAEIGDEIPITIPEGASTKDIAEILYKNDLIDSAVMFRISSKIGEYDGKYRQGNYLIVKGTEDEEIMKILQSGVVYTNAVKVTVPEGYTAKQIAETLEEAGVVTATEFLDEMDKGTFDYEFLADIPVRDNYLEGYLFPATYEFEQGKSPHDIIIKFLDRFQIEYNNILKGKDTKYTIDQIVTIASMVESEIQVDDERAIAAGVIYNRLKVNMPLQIDSTVQYALSTRNEIVAASDLEVDSPYNTYKYKGLPLGPISNPGEAALEAAANPDDNKYIYYVLKERGSGEHIFAETYDEFLKAKETYKNSFN
ncbi:MAG TPA: endolytic transglycosylase MltG [Lachnospiraceae bacterium]|nr:endolytic transglycosylase MltG [Lachnospiraceae bacterium]